MTLRTSLGFLFYLVMYRSNKFINPNRLSILGIALFLVIVLFNVFANSISILEARNYLVPIYILSALFLLNRWFGHLMLLDTEGRSAFRLIFPSLSLILSFLSFTPQSLIGLSPALTSIILSTSSILFVALLMGTKGDEQSPSLTLAIALLLGSLSIFSPKLLFLSPFIFYLLYTLKSLSWRNVFVFFWGLILVPLFLLPYLWYLKGADVLILLTAWEGELTKLNTYSDLNVWALLTMFLTAFFGQMSYFFSSSKLSIAQGMLLSSFNVLMWLSFFYILFIESKNIFVLALFVLCSSLALSRAVITLNKRMYYAFLFVYTLLILSNVFYLNY